jgi:hypothetical protein
MDGLLLQRIEAGPGFEPADALRRARVMLEVLLAAATSARPAVPAA